MVGRKPLLSDWEVDELMLMHRNGATLQVIAYRFGISTRTVRRYVKREKEKEGVGR